MSCFLGSSKERNGDAASCCLMVDNNKYLTVKCSLGALGAQPKIRKALEKLAHVYHRLALRGSLVATDVATKAFLADNVCKVFSTTWWNRCYNSCGHLKGKPNLCTADDAINASVQQLFGGSTRISSDKTWTFVAELSKTSVTMTQNMMASQFHIQLKKAFLREILIWEYVHDKEIADKKYKQKIVVHFTERAAASDHISELPEDAPSDLCTSLGALADQWKLDFAVSIEKYFCRGIGCPTEAWIYTQKPLHLDEYERTKSQCYLEGIFLWIRKLQQHAKKCLLILSSLTSPEEAQKRFGKSVKLLAILPMNSFNLPYFSFGEIGLQDVCKLANFRINRRDHLTFYDVFPNIRSYDRGRECKIIKTDGVSVSLVMLAGQARRTESELLLPRVVLPKRTKEEREISKLEQAEKRKALEQATPEEQEAAKQAAKEEREAKRKLSQTDASNCSKRPRKKARREAEKILAVEGAPFHGHSSHPVWPLPQQRLVGIDPGRRDMVAVVVKVDQQIVKQFTVSTRSFHHERGTASAARHTELELKRKRVGGTSLHEALLTLPSRRDSDCWDAYLVCLLPLLDAIFDVYGKKCMRRRRFRSYGKGLRALDDLCKKITGGAPDTLVAFGDGSSCSTGFGQPPAPLSGLRARLVKVHKAKITLIKEHLTSQVCSRCVSSIDSVQLHKPTVRHSFEKVHDSHKMWKRKEGFLFRDGQYFEKPTGIRCCRFCRDGRNRPLFHHRDLNSAKNMLRLYEHFVEHGAYHPSFRPRKRQG